MKRHRPPGRDRLQRYRSDAELIRDIFFALWSIVLAITGSAVLVVTVLNPALRTLETIALVSPLLSGGGLWWVIHGRRKGRGGR